MVSHKPIWFGGCGRFGVKLAHIKIVVEHQSTLERWLGRLKIRSGTVRIDTEVQNEHPRDGSYLIIWSRRT